MLSSSDPTFPLFPVFAFIGFILSVIPLTWHIQAWNSGTCAYMIWTGIACLIFFVNSLVWAGNLNNPSPVWCDISSKIIIGISVGIPASILCISRRLYYITAGTTASITRDDKRRMVIVDLCIAVGMPFLIMILHYIVQGHRFDLYEDIGCYPVIYNTLPAYFLYFMWPVVFGAVSFVFSSLTLRSFWIRRLQFSQLISTNSSMTMSRYLRLVFLALVDIMCTLPIGIFTIYLQNKGVTLSPWISWEDTHYNFSRVGLFPALFWRSDASFRSSMELARWLPVVCAFVFFALFGFAEEAKKHYKLAFWAVMKCFGVRPAAPEKKHKPKPFHEGGYPWTKPDLKSVNLSSPGVITRVALSPTSSSSPSKKLDRSHSFSTSASTHLGAGEYELESYKPMPIHPDIEKLAGLPSPTTTDGDTIYGTPPTYSSTYSKSSPSMTDGYYRDVPQSASAWSATTTMRLTDATPPPSPGSSSANLNLHHLPPPPPRKPSASSITSRAPTPEAPLVVADSVNNRVYISPVPRSASRLNCLNGGRTQSPSSPTPFVNTAGVSPEPDSPLSQARNTVQVIVLKTEITTTSDD